jgi:Family of unknown function (DUF6311)
MEPATINESLGEPATRWDSKKSESVSPWLFWLVLAFGIAFTALSLHPAFISGTGRFWNLPSPDITTSEIGWFYYAMDDWRFPLLTTPTYNTPEGSGIVLSDSLPLIAVPAKLIYKMLWPKGSTPPIYMGLWVALCFLLQALAASRLLLALEVRRILPHLCGVALFCYMPMFFRRFWHMALMAHFLILIALLAYVVAKRQGLSRRRWIAVCVLPTLALVIQPYLAAMIGAVVGATIVDQWRERRLSVLQATGCFGLVALTAAFAYVVGGMDTAATVNYGDYGFYSMNLLSPWIPVGESLSGALLHLPAQMSLPNVAQYEGSAYVGLGVIFLCLATFPAIANWKKGLNRHAILACAILVLLLLAISNRIGFGPYEIVRLPLPTKIASFLSTFRTAGRFVWVAVYALLAGVIAILVQRCSPRRLAALLSIAAILQIADIAPLQLGLRSATDVEMPHTINTTQWTGLIESHERIFEFPSYLCDGLFDNGIPGVRNRELEIDFIAAKRNKPTNSAYLARPRKDCARERKQAAESQNEPGTLYLYRSSQDIGDYLLQHGADLHRCGYLDDVVVCSHDVDLSYLR